MKAPARILYPFVGDTLGGSHISALHLIENLDRDTFQPIVGLHVRGLLSKYLEEKGIDWIALPGAASSRFTSAELLSAVMLTPALRHFLKSRAIDLVHTNDGRMHTLWTLPARLAGSRLIWHWRTMGEGRRYRLLARFAHRQIAISGATAQDHPGTSDIISNPIADTGAVNQRRSMATAIRRRLGVAEGTILVTQVANWTPQKRPELFVDVAAELSRRMARGDFACVMLGEQRSPARSNVDRRIAEHGVNDIIKAPGSVWPVEPWIGASNVLVATSLDEGFGRSLVEAMLCGTPVVASNSGGHREIIQHGINGLLVEPDDIKGYADAITSLIADPASAARMTERAMLDAGSRYSVDTHARKVQDVYRQVLDT